MKTFADLNFRTHPTGQGLQGTLFFPNGYGVSVVRFNGSYTSNDNEWEVAILHGNEESFKLCYSTHITSDVIGHLTEAEVTETMKKVQELELVTV
jgi:hypothetical protein